MFTGIVSAIGTIADRSDPGDTRLRITAPWAADDIAIGASIACSGVCLTVVDRGDADGGGCWFAVDVSGETIACTAPGMWDAGRRLNLERALCVGDELGGHIVTGHVDGVGQVVSIDPVGDSWTVAFAPPAPLARLIAAKGSITIEGVSLTVNRVTDDPHAFTVNLIPHTRAVTTLSELAPGRPVNLEVDVLARYLARMQGLALDT